MIYNYWEKMDEFLKSGIDNAGNQLIPGQYSLNRYSGFFTYRDRN
jgi:hypothetical protein